MKEEYFIKAILEQTSKVIQIRDRDMFARIYKKGLVIWMGSQKDILK